MSQRPDPRASSTDAADSGVSDGDLRSEELRRRAAAPILRHIDRDLLRAAEEHRPALRLIRSELFAPDFSVRRLLRILGQSHNFTSRFKRDLGIGLRHYIEERRLDCAARLLTDTRLEVREIAQLVGYRSLRTFDRAFQRRMGSRPKEYRDSGGRRSRGAAEGLREVAATTAEGGSEGAPRWVAGVASAVTDRRCVRCGTELESERRVRIFERTTERHEGRLVESLEPTCDLCALEHAPRELLDPLFVQAVGRRGDRREDLDRMIDPETLAAGLRRQLSAEDAEVLIRALVLRYPRSAVVVSDLLRGREAETRRRFEA